MWSERRRDARTVFSIFGRQRYSLRLAPVAEGGRQVSRSGTNPPWTRLTGSRSAGPVFAAFPGFLAGKGLASPENPCPAGFQNGTITQKKIFLFLCACAPRQTVREMLPYRRPAVLVSKRERGDAPVFCPLRLPVSDGNEQHDGEYPRAKAQDWRWNQKSERIDCCPSDKSESGTDIPRIYGRRTDRHEKRL